MKKVNNFTVIESVYGDFIVNRNCLFQAESLIKTGYPHIKKELDTILTIIQRLPKDSVVLDVGANIGLICIPVAEIVKANGGKVYAYEVQRMLFNALCGSVALNDLQNLYVFNLGLGDKAEKLKVPIPDYSSQFDYGEVSLVEQNALLNFEYIEMKKIDDLNLERLDFLKIDVEGMELHVLNGGQKTVESFRPICWVEYWKVSKIHLSQFFSNLNYTLFVMDELNVLCVPNEKIGREIVCDAQNFENLL